MRNDASSSKPALLMGEGFGGGDVAENTRQSKREYKVSKLFLALVALLLLQSATFADSSVDPALCQTLVQHVPDADVAYQPGFDVHGKPVAPADLPGQPSIQLPDVIKIPLTLDLAKTLNLKPSAYPFNKFGSGTEAQLGVLTIEGNRVEFNGKPLTDAQQDKLAVLCLQPK